MKNVYEVRERLLNIVNSINQDLLYVKINEQTWSIGQILPQDTTHRADHRIAK